MACVPFSTVGPPTTPSALTPQVGGIIIPDTAKEKPQQGQVIAVGKGKVRDDGGIQPLDVKAGDNV